MMPTLLEKAMEAAPAPRGRDKAYSAERVELAIAWATGAVKCSQAAHALGCGTNSVNGRCLSTLLVAIRRGDVILTLRGPKANGAA